MNPKIFSRTHIWGLGAYINPDSYRYVSLQLGPFWIYLYHERWLLDAKITWYLIRKNGFWYYLKHRRNKMKLL